MLEPLFRCLLAVFLQINSGGRVVSTYLVRTSFLTRHSFNSFLVFYCNENIEFLKSHYSFPRKKVLLAAFGIYFGLSLFEKAPRRINTYHKTNCVTSKTIWARDKAMQSNIHGKIYFHRKRSTQSVHRILLKIGDSIRCKVLSFSLCNL